MREYKEIRAPRGKKLNARGWQQEAALRLLMNNLDPEVAKECFDGSCMLFMKFIFQFLPE